jgi:hypothetical protein
MLNVAAVLLVALDSKLLTVMPPPIALMVAPRRFVPPRITGTDVPGAAVLGLIELNVGTGAEGTT